MKTKNLPADHPAVQHQNDLNRVPRYPSHLGLEIDEIAEVAYWMINQRAKKFYELDKFPYPAQFMLEELIKKLQDSV